MLCSLTTVALAAKIKDCLRAFPGWIETSVGTVSPTPPKVLVGCPVSTLGGYALSALPLFRGKFSLDYYKQRSLWVFTIFWGVHTKHLNIHSNTTQI
jgi:hypothetical protein